MDDHAAPLDAPAPLPSVGRTDSGEAQPDRVRSILTTLGRINRLVLTAEDPDTMALEFCRILAEDRTYLAVWIGLVDQDEPTRTAGVVRRDAGTSVACAHLDEGAVPACANEAATTGRTVVIDDQDAQVLCATCTAPAGPQSHATMAVPLVHGDSVTGVLVVHAEAERFAERTERAFLEDLTRSLAYAIESLEVTRRDRLRADELALLHEVTRAALEARGDVERLSRRLIDTLTSDTGIEACCLAVWDTGRDRIATHLASPGWHERGLPNPDSTRVAEALSGHETALCTPDLAVVDRVPCAPSGADQVLFGIPLTAHDTPLGVAYLLMAPGYRCDQDDVERTERVAGHIALALARTLAARGNQRRLEAMFALHETGLDLSAQRELRTLLQAIVHRSGRLLGASMGGLYLYDDGALELVVARGVLEPFVGRSIAIGEGAAGQAVQHRDAVVVEDYSTWPERAAMYVDLPVRSVLAVPILWQDEILGALHVEHMEAGAFGPDDVELLTLFADQAAVAIANARLIDRLTASADEVRAAYDATLEGWVRALDLRDEETEGHTQRVTQMTLRLARRLGIPEPQLADIRRGALLHDIGKIGIPDRILRKPGPLDADEHAEMRRHPQLAHDMLNPIAYLRPALDIPFAHHERWDGTGYPRGLAGEEIPLAARLFAVVDVWDAMLFDRPYRPGLPPREVESHLLRQAGAQFDPEVVREFLAMLHEDEK